MGKVKKVMIVAVSLSVLGALTWSIVLATHSNLFRLTQVEVSHSSGSPSHLDDETLIRLAQVPIGKVSLLELNFRTIERNLLSNEWIRDVQLKKSFPHTLLISVVYREPRAYLQARKGKLSYVDSAGKVFGSVNLLTYRDLPFLQGFSAEDPGKLREALEWVELWESSSLGKGVQLSSLQLDPERGVSALVTYPIREGALKVRAVVHFGESIDNVKLRAQFENLNQVILYLSKNYIATRRISLEQNKKVVVKIPYAS